MNQPQPTIPENKKNEEMPDNVNADIVGRVDDRKFWASFCPDLTIEGTHDDAAFTVDDPGKTHEKLVRSGYIHLAQPGLNTPLDVITALFTKIVEHGLPPVFAFVYDELWQINTQLRHLVALALNSEDYAMLPDFWAWRVAPGQAGWTPHRDKLTGSLYADKTPKSVTVWVPLTIAHPLNGCMYVLPANRDKLYAIDKGAKFAGRLPDVRALPADPGDVLLWTQHIMHWGARSAEEHHLPPRMSVAFEYQRHDEPPFNRPLLNPHVVPSFEQRLALIAKQVMQYTHMYGFHDDLVAIAKDLRGRFDLPDAY